MVHDVSDLYLKKPGNSVYTYQGDAGTTLCSSVKFLFFLAA
jgi:hypothetical protein